MSLLHELDHDNLSNKVYATLCDALIKGQFQPGDRLKVRELAEQLGTSVTPVRDAILRLAHDNALVFQSARDIRIPNMTEAHYMEIRQIRMKLEALAAEVAAQTATPADIERLEKLLRENEKAIEAKDRLRGTELNQAFHFELPIIANMPVLHGILRKLWLQMGPLIAEIYLDGGRLMTDHHRLVLDALRSRDSQAAISAIRNDIVYGGRTLLSKVRSENAKTPD